MQWRERLPLTAGRAVRAAEQWTAEEVCALKVRIKFSKHGNIRYVGHLDIMRYFQKAIRRAELPIRYSEGFSPHQIMSFSAPLGTALESDAEYMDTELTGDMDLPELCDRLDKQMCDGMHILGAVRLGDKAKPSMAVMDSADFEVRLKGSGIKDDTAVKESIGLTDNIDSKDGIVDYAAACEELMARKEIMHEKVSKKTGEIKSQDIRPMIYDLTGGPGYVKMHIAQGSNANLNPKAVMDVLGISFEDSIVIRKEMYAPGRIPLDRYTD